MNLIATILSLGSGLLAVIVLVQVVAARTNLPDATVLSLAGIALGSLLPLAAAMLPGPVQEGLALLFSPDLPAEAYLWVFLPPLLFQSALSIEFREMMPDLGPILLLAVVAVFVATAVTGFAMAAVTAQGLTVCLLLGAIIATTDPAAVIAVFRDVGAPGRLMRLVSGESLLNDAAAIAIMSVLLAMLSGDAAEASPIAGLRELALSLGGGAVCGIVAGRITAALLPALGGLALAEAALTLALPYPLYLLADQGIGVSGVVAVVAAGLVINALGRTRLSPRNWTHLQLIWEQIAMLAGAMIFLLATLQARHLLGGMEAQDLLLLLVLVVAALGARLLVLFGLLPVLGWLRLGAPVSTAYKLVIAWGGLRGAVTVVLALGLAENPVLPPEQRLFVARFATAFVLFSLLVNGTTLRWAIRVLGLDRLSPQNQALQWQAVHLATTEVLGRMAETARTFHLPEEIARQAASEYRTGMEAGLAQEDFDLALPERDRLIIGLVTLATRERSLIPLFGSGVLSIRNLDTMMRNTGDMIDAARRDGRLGYNRAAQSILDPGWTMPFLEWLDRHLGLRRPLENALSDRFELLLCRRAVLEQLRRYNQASIGPLLSGRMTVLLDSVLAARIERLDQAVDQVRARFPDITAMLEKRLLLLQGLRDGARVIDRIRDESLISPEVADRIQRTMRASWRIALTRPPHRRGDQGRRQDAAPDAAP